VLPREEVPLPQVAVLPELLRSGVLCPRVLCPGVLRPGRHGGPGYGAGPGAEAGSGSPGSGPQGLRAD
jgi:hypothetical protein